MTDITVVDKITGDTLTAAEFQQLLDALKNGTLNVNTKYLELEAGTASAGTAPIKLTGGVLMTTPESGAIEYADGRFYITNKSLQKVLDRTSDVKSTTTTVVDTITETAVFTASVPANSWVAKNILKLEVYGVMSNKATSQNVTIRVKVGGNTIATLVSAGGLITDKCWNIGGTAIVRSVGATGGMAWNQSMSIDGEASGTDCGVEIIDTTGALDIAVTAEWDNDDIGNTFSCIGGFVEYKN